MTTTLPTAAPLDLGPDIEIRNGRAFDTRDIRETTTGQSWEDSTHVHRTGDHWTVTFLEGEKRFVNYGDGLLRELAHFGLYKIEVLNKWFSEKVSFDGYEIGEVSAEVRGDHTHLGAAVASFLEAVGVPTWFLPDHSNFTEEVWDAVLDGSIEPTLATAQEMLAAIHEVEALRDWEARGSMPSDPFLDEGDSDGPYCTISALSRGVAKVVRRAVNDAGQDWDDLADASGIQYDDLFFLLSGHAEFTTSEICSIAEALGLTPTELIRQAEIVADEEAN